MLNFMAEELQYNGPNEHSSYLYSKVLAPPGFLPADWDYVGYLITSLQQISTSVNSPLFFGVSIHTATLLSASEDGVHISNGFLM